MFGFFQVMYKSQYDRITQPLHSNTEDIADTCLYRNTICPNEANIHSMKPFDFDDVFQE